jgi:hypothetical protein
MAMFNVMGSNIAIDITPSFKFLFSKHKGFYALSII